MPVSAVRAGLTGRAARPAGQTPTVLTERVVRVASAGLAWWGARAWPDAGARARAWAWARSQDGVRRLASRARLTGPEHPGRRPGPGPTPNPICPPGHAAQARGRQAGSP